MDRRLKRGAGILLPISSLPSPYGIGTFGRAAYEFAKKLKRADILAGSAYRAYKLWGQPIPVIFNICR